MQFGVREICDVVFKAKAHGHIGTLDVVPGQPVLYIDSAKTSTLEGSATSVYATGGRGNSRLLTWEGEKTLTFTVEDALLSEMGFALLSGAGVLKASATSKVYVHKTATASISYTDSKENIDLSEALNDSETISGDSPVFIMGMKDGSIDGMFTGYSVSTDKKSLIKETGASEDNKGKIVFVDFYVEKTSGVTEMTIDADTFGGYYYVEASTLFKRKSDGKDLPAEIVIPNVKIQSNFTFSMASTGDPSTFSFVMDAMPGYTRFDQKKKVLCVMNVIDTAAEEVGSRVDSVSNSADANTQYPLH